MSIEFNSDFIKRLKQRDEEAISMLFREAGPKIYNYIYYRTGGQQNEAEDIHSEVFCDAIDHVQSLSFNHNVLAWLYRIARSKVADYFRARARDSKWKFSTPIEDFNLEADMDSPEWELLLKEHKILIQAAMASLDDKHQKVLELKYFKQQSVKEIAEDFDLTPKAIENMLYRARKQFDSELKRMSKEKIYSKGGAV